MRKRIALHVLAASAVLQSGCIDVNFRDAVSAGVFDFLSGSVTAVLSNLLSVAGM
jgi:hypothetical protein